MPHRKIRVLQLVNGFVLGGAERVVTMLAMHADRSRFEIIPCAVKRSGPLEEDLRTNQINYRVLGIKRRSIWSGPFFLADLKQLLEALTETCKGLSIDIIHAHLTENALLAVLAARRIGVPRVCATVHNVIFSPTKGKYNPLGWLRRTAIERLFSQTDRIIAVSDEVAHAVRRSARVPKDHIVTIPNGVEPNEFRYDGNRWSLRRALGFPSERLIAITVGRLSRQKGYAHLLEALALMPVASRPLMLIVGDGPDRPELELRVSALGLEQDIQFLGHRRDVPALLAAADVFVLSSLWEGLPLALLEAMAAGLPAVVTAVGGNPEVVEDGTSGLLVPPGDEQAFSTALSHLLEDSSRRERMGRAASQRFDQCFSLRRFVEAHEILYEEMLAEPPISAITPEAESVRSLG
jgi:glycosyltransferase involved in cell wall biosynthesis